MISQDIVDGEGNLEARICVDCQTPKPIEEFQRTRGGNRASDCKACRHKKYVDGVEAKKGPKGPVDKNWVIQQATRLYHETNRNSDKIRLLDTISRNLGEDRKTPIDDAKVIRDMIASKKKISDMGR